MIDWIFRAEGFAPHGMCLIWDQDVLAMHAISDAVIALSYFSIPAVLFIILTRRPDLNPFGVLHLFSLFIVACGVTHILAILTLWEPVYNLSSVAKVLTAVVSAITAVVLWPLLPRVLATPSHQELALANEQLSKTADELTEASQARARFLAMMSHEIRTPLTGIIGFTELLRRENLEDRARRSVDRIATASRSLQSLLGDILEFSRMDQGTLTLHEEPVELHALVDQIEREVAGEAEAKGLELRVKLAPGVPRWIESDPLRLRQILINLTSNAIRYTALGRVQVTVSAEGPATPRGRGRLEISVKDTGPGIAEHQREAIFDAFVQAGNRDVAGTGSSRAGAGLGLAIVRKVVEVLDGDIRLKSAVGVGSEFVVTLPYRVPAAVGSGAADFSVEESADNPNFGRVLLADDVEMNRDLFANLLADLSDEVVVVSDGQEALNRLSAEPFDAAVIDVQMPVMDGLDFVRAVRSSDDPSIRVLPVVGLSAAAYAEDTALALEAGMDSYVTKPASRETLIRGLMNAVGRRSDENGSVASVLPAPMPAEPSDPRAFQASSTLQDVTFDRAFFDRQADVLGPENVRSYLKKLETELATRRQALADARARKDTAEIMRLSHALASAGGNLGFAAIYRVARNVEVNAATSTVADLDSDLRLLDATLEDALSRIPDLIVSQS